MRDAILPERLNFLRLTGVWTIDDEASAIADALEALDAGSRYSSPS